MTKSFFGYFVVSELAGDFSFGEYQDAVRDGEHFSKLGRYEKDRETLLSELVHDLEDLGFRADINAAGRFIQQKDLRQCEQALCHNHLLLVAAAQRRHRVGRSARFDGQLAHQRGDVLRFPVLGKPEKSDESLEIGKRDIVADRELLDQTKSLTVFGNQHQPKIDPVPDRFVQDPPAA